MNTPQIVKQKAAYEKVCEFKTTGFLYSPKEDNSGIMHIASSTGEIFQFNDSTSDQVLSLNGQPNSIAFDSNGIVYVSDLSSNSVMFKAPKENDPNPQIEHTIAKECDGRPFKGPTSLTYNKEDNILYFSDSGLFDNASLAPFDSVIYSIDLETRVLKPILENLSFISDICYDGGRECLYIAETFMNRVLRLKMNNDGVFHASVFYQFSGRLGPSALTVDDNGNVYIARYEYSETELDLDIEADGLISVINKAGNLVGEMNLPKMPEVTGLYISPKKKENMYITIKNSTGVFKVKISAFCAEVDKYEEFLKLNEK